MNFIQQFSQKIGWQQYQVCVNTPNQANPAFFVFGLNSSGTSTASRLVTIIKKCKVKKFGVFISFMEQTTDSAWQIRKNDDVMDSIPVTALTTGLFEKDVDIEFEEGDKLNFVLVPTDTGNLVTVESFGAVFE